MDTTIWQYVYIYILFIPFQNVFILSLLGLNIGNRTPDCRNIGWLVKCVDPSGGSECRLTCRVTIFSGERTCWFRGAKRCVHRWNKPDYTGIWEVGVGPRFFENTTSRGFAWLTTNLVGTKSHPPSVYIQNENLNYVKSRCDLPRFVIWIWKKEFKLTLFSKEKKRPPRFFSRWTPGQDSIHHQTWSQERHEKPDNLKAGP